MEESNMIGKVLMFLCFMIGIKPSKERELDKAFDDAAEKTRRANAKMKNVRERLQKAQADMHARIDLIADAKESHDIERSETAAGL